MTNISLVIPFYNEIENGTFLYAELKSFIERNQELQFEVILIDDGSEDQSFDFFSKQFNSFPAIVKIIKLSKNFGSHSAVRAGLIHAKSEYCVFVSADLQDPLDLVIDLYNEAMKGFEIVFASRNNLPTTFFERLFSNLYSYLMKKYVNKFYPKLGFDTVLFSSKITENLNLNIESNSSIQLQILNLGFKQSFISYQKEVRKNGKSKWSTAKKIKLFIDSFVAFSYFPIRFVTILGVVLFFTGTIFTCVLFFRKLILNDLVNGWTMLISILCIGFGVTNISLGIIAEYLWRTFDSSRNRPVFIIEKVVEFNK
jgi:glycosyltransferase involved in cell wall biosynthesis